MGSVAEERGAEGGGEACRILEVLDRQRDAGQGARITSGSDHLIDGCSLIERSLCVDGHEGIDLAVERLDLRKAVTGELDRRASLGPDVGGEVSDSVCAKVHGPIDITTNAQLLGALTSSSHASNSLPWAT